MLNLMRENEASVQAELVHCQDLLQQASKMFHILDPELGDEELVKSVAAEMAKLTALMAKKSPRQQG